MAPTNEEEIKLKDY
ncbi:hypothetical protein M8C21_002755, partial [Ambrosia artemisiifolia]